MNACHPQEAASLESQLTFYWPQPAPASPARRTLKIEEEGDFWRSPAKPKIRLIGRWLARAGFNPGGRVCVTCVAPGIIELRCPPVA